MAFGENAIGDITKLASDKETEDTSAAMDVESVKESTDTNKNEVIAVFESIVKDIKSFISEETKKSIEVLDLKNHVYMKDYLETRLAALDSKVSGLVAPFRRPFLTPCLSYR